MKRGLKSDYIRAMDPAASSPADDTPLESDRAVMARHSGVLARVAEVGAGLTETIAKQVKDSGWLGVDGPRMFEMSARAVRQTIALEARLRQELLAREEYGAAEMARRAALAREKLRRRKEDVRRGVEAAIEAAADRQQAGPSDVERLLADLNERLEDRDVALLFGDRPVGEIVKGICRVFGIRPEEEAWPAELVKVTVPAGAVFDRPAAGSTASDAACPHPPVADATGPALSRGAGEGNDRAGLPRKAPDG